MRYVAFFAPLILVTPAAAQSIAGHPGAPKRPVAASFIQGTFADSPGSCARLRDIRAGRTTPGNLSTPTALNRRGVISDSTSFMVFKSVTRRGPNRWATVLVGYDDNAPFEAATTMIRRNPSTIVFRQSSLGLYAPASLNPTAGAAVPGQPQWRLIRERSTESQTWVRCPGL
jgi:hypothetical protein